MHRESPVYFAIILPLPGLQLCQLASLSNLPQRHLLGNQFSRAGFNSLAPRGAESIDDVICILGH